MNILNKLWTQKSRIMLKHTCFHMKTLWNIWFKNMSCTRNIKSSLKKILGCIFTLFPCLCSYCTEQMQIKCLLCQPSGIFCSNFIKLLFLETVSTKINVWLISYCLKWTWWLGGGSCGEIWMHMARHANSVNPAPKTENTHFFLAKFSFKMPIA